MIPEILLLAGVWEHNRKHWFLSFPFHFGLYLLAGLIALLLAVGWFLRNSIIERISNPLLAQYNLRVTDVSLDALATRNASISHLEFEHSSGAIVAIDNLSLPIRTSSDGFSNYSAEKIVIELN